MATPTNSFIIKHYDSFGGNFVDSQYLGAAYETGKPAKLEQALEKIYSSKSDFWEGKTLMSIIGSANTEEISADTFRWKLMGAEDKFARIVENLEPSNTTPGINNTVFKIKLDLDYYTRPDILMSENNNYPLVIVDGPIQDGSGYIYSVKLQSDSPADYLPVENLEIGREFSKVWTSIANELTTKLSSPEE